MNGGSCTCGKFVDNEGGEPFLTLCLNKTNMDELQAIVDCVKTLSMDEKLHEDTRKGLNALYKKLWPGIDACATFVVPSDVKNALINAKMLKEIFMANVKRTTLMCPS